MGGGGGDGGLLPKPGYLHPEGGRGEGQATQATVSYPQLIKTGHASFYLTLQF